jgi:hypothetical protein
MKLNAIITGILTLLAVGAVEAKDVAKIKSPFEPVGSNASSGTFQLAVGNNRAQVFVKVAGLVTNADYQFLIGGVPEVTFNSGPKGAGRFKLTTTSSDPNLLLDLDPRGHMVAINDGATNVLALEVAGSNEPTNYSHTESATLERTTNALAGSATLAYRLKRGLALFTVSLVGVVPGNYEVYVSGVLRGAGAIPAGGKGRLTFSNDGNTNHWPLDFEPRGRVVDVVNNGLTLFTGLFQADATNLTACAFSVVEAALLVNTNLTEDASGHVRFITETDCRRNFNVEVEDLAVGTYELWTGGVLRGLLDVQSGSPNKGRLEFTTEVDDSYKLLLDFDPVGQLIEVKQGADVFFSGLGATNASPTNVCEALTIDVPLFNQGVEGYAAAKGDARFRIRDDCDWDFRVEIQDLSTDAFNVYVDGTKVGTIDSGSGGGSIEFDTTPDEPNEIPLTFDPRGKQVEVRKGAASILSRVLPVQ